LILIAAAALAAAAPAPSKCPDLVTSEAFVCRGLAASNSGQADAAAAAFEQAAEAQTENPAEKARLWAAAGNMWIAASQPGKAAVALDKALASPQLQAEQRGEALLDRARAAEAQNDLNTARAKVTEAALTVAGDPFLWYFSAALAIRENDPARAKTAIGKALNLAPKDPTILFEAGHVFQFAGQTEEARRYWTEARDADPDGAVGRAAVQAMNMLPALPADGAAGPPQKPAPQPKPKGIIAPERALKE
jgi:tetratricopeptide (TPR) repeat protein